ncbi:MAG TPA: HAMP domain-containing sensor histidine kinase [Niabella sp.]|nr:HAMP domain-containing sensor histidine kinase [Niabella sp.]
MKKLLNKTLRTFAVYSLIVLAASVPAYYYLVDGIWLSELDENNEIIAGRTEIGLNRLNLSDTMLAESIILWNKIQPGTSLRKASAITAYPDSTYTVLRQNPYATHKDIDRFRGLVRLIHINNTPYYLTVETNVEETEETVAAIAIVTLLFFLILVMGFLLLNRRLSARLWKPFRGTLSKLKTFNLNNQMPIVFDKSDTLEFEELNRALSKLLDHNISVYKTQKEFTENASHELQTPLAIIKNKLDVLLQKETVTDRQYQIIEEINRALTRITRINKNLLLLAKIENHQFDSSELTRFDTLLLQCMDGLQEHVKEKNINIGTDIQPGVEVKGNSGLTEVLINNFLINAIRHSPPGDAIVVKLSNSVFEVANPGKQELHPDALFTRFSRLSANNSGSGLGLSIVGEICRVHNWKAAYSFENNRHIFSVAF